MDFIFDCRWSDELDDKFINDFLYVLGHTWGDGPTLQSRQSFERRYVHNIYGRSLLTVVYCDSEPAATDAMWRNDIFEREAYQTIDTCTLEPYRGKGLFRQITNKELSILGDGVLVYGFPNQNSFPGYVKFGWTVLNMGRLKVYMNVKLYNKYSPDLIDYNYANWHLASRKDRISYVKKRDNYFLVIPTKLNYVVRIIGRTEQKCALLFEKYRLDNPIMIYTSTLARINTEGRGVIVAMGWNNETIPLWKCDAI